MSSKPIIGYWDVRGKAQPICSLLAYVGVDFEDKRYTEFVQWFGDGDKFKLGLDFPNLSHSVAIIRHIARKYNLDGITEKEKIAISLVEQQIQDLNDSLISIISSDNYEKLREDFLIDLPNQLTAISTFLAQKPFVAGPNISYADFMLHEYLKKISFFASDSFDKYRNLVEFLARIDLLPLLSDYIKNQKSKLFYGRPNIKWNALL